MFRAVADRNVDYGDRRRAFPVNHGSHRRMYLDLSGIDRTSVINNVHEHVSDRDSCRRTRQKCRDAGGEHRFRNFGKTKEDLLGRKFWRGFLLEAQGEFLFESVNGVTGSFDSEFLRAEKKSIEKDPNTTEVLAVPDLIALESTHLTTARSQYMSIRAERQCQNTVRPVGISNI